MAWLKDKFNYSRQKIRELNGDYLKLAWKKEVEYSDLSAESKIDIILAKRNVNLFRKNIVEQSLSHKVINGKVKKVKMGESSKLLTGDYIYYLKNIILSYEYKIYKVFNTISIDDPQKDKIKAKLDEAEVYDQPYGVEYFDLNFVEEIKAKDDPFTFIMFYITIRDIYDMELIAIEKNLTKLHKKPRSNENEKMYFAYYTDQIKNYHLAKYKRACELYFYDLPIDHPNRAYVRKRILKNSILFKPLISSMLYTIGESTNVWRNFKELVSPDRELQFIVRALVDHAQKLVAAEGPKSKYQDNKYNLYFFSTISKITKIDITDFIRTTPDLKHAKEILDNIPSDVFERRKELFEEIIKIECSIFINNNFSFPLTGFANATTYNTGGYM